MSDKSRHWRVRFKLDINDLDIYFNSIKYRCPPLYEVHFALFRWLEETGDSFWVWLTSSQGQNPGQRSILHQEKIQEMKKRKTARRSKAKKVNRQRKRKSLNQRKRKERKRKRASKTIKNKTKNDRMMMNQYRSNINLVLVISRGTLCYLLSWNFTCLFFSMNYLPFDQNQRDEGSETYSREKISYSLNNELPIEIGNGWRNAQCYSSKQDPQKDCRLLWTWAHCIHYHRNSNFHSENGPICS